MDKQKKSLPHTDGEVCGTCKKGDEQPDGNYCRCSKDGKFHKCYDSACNEYEKGGNE